MRFLTLIGATVSTCFSSPSSEIASAGEPLKAFEISNASGCSSYFSFHPNPGSGAGVAVICAKSSGGDWRVTNGRFQLQTASPGIEKLAITWATGAKLAGTIKDNRLTIKELPENPGLVGSVFGFRSVLLPIQFSASMSSAAHARPVVSATLMGSEEWVLRQKLDQDLLRIVRDTSKGWFD
jgi:hypothetical protein